MSRKVWKKPGDFETGTGSQLVNAAQEQNPRTRLISTLVFGCVMHNNVTSCESKPIRIRIDSESELESKNMFTVRSVDRLARIRNPLGLRSLGIISLNPLPRLRVAMRILLRGLPAPHLQVPVWVSLANNFYFHIYLLDTTYKWPAYVRFDILNKYLKQITKAQKSYANECVSCQGAGQQWSNIWVNCNQDVVGYLYTGKKILKIGHSLPKSFKIS